MGRERSDAALWAQGGRGDAGAFGVLYERHARAVLAFCLRRTADPSLAEDLTSVVFLEAWRRRESLRLTTDSARPLLLGIATNVLRHQWRAQRRHAAALRRLDHRHEAEVHEEDAAERLAAAAALRAACDALRALPPRELEVLALTAWGELSYDETAQALGIPVGTVRSRLSRARARLVRCRDVSLHPPAEAPVGGG